MKLLSKMSLRMGMSLLLIILQMVAIIAVTILILTRFPLVSYAGMFISFLVFLFLLKKDETTIYRMTWIIIVLLLPSVGGVIYLLLGKEHFVRRSIYAHVKEHEIVAKLMDSDGNLPFVNQVTCGRMFSLMKYIRRSSSYHAYENTESKYYSMGAPMFEDMLKSISQAEKFIFFEYFIVCKGAMWDRLVTELEKKAAEGVEVRLIVDDFGSQKLFTNIYIAELRSKNIQVLRFNPLIPFFLVFMNNRDHRKILVVDGKTAFVGGMNIADEYIGLNNRLGVWKDTGLRLKGEAVWSFTLMFIEMWDTFCKTCERINTHTFYKAETDDTYTTDGLILPYGDSPLNRDRLGENIYIEILNQAQRYVYIFTPYLIISEKMIHALQMAARRGVDVRIVTPGVPDKKLVFRLTRSYYSSLLEDGVRIFEYSPGFLHAKSFVSDDEVAVVGTINLDYRSLYLHFENAVLLYRASSITDIRDDALQAIAESREVILAERKKQTISMIDALLHLFAPLM